MKAETARDIAKLIQGDPSYSLSVDMIEDYIVGYAKRKVDEKTDAIKNQFCLGYHPEPHDEFEWDEEAIEKIENAPEPNFDK